MQHFFMSLDTLVILHYNKYHDYGNGDEKEKI